MISCQVLSDQREAVIRKLFGNTNARVFRRLVLKEYAVNLILFGTVVILLVGMYLRGIRPVHMDLLKSLGFAALLYGVFWSIAAVFSYVFFVRATRTHAVKQSSHQTNMDVLSFVLKVGLLVVVIPQMMLIFENAPGVIRENILLRENRTYMNRNVGIDGARDGPDGKALDESEHVKQTIALLLEFPWIYQDFSHNFVPEEIFEAMPPELVAEQTIQLPYVVANRGFLERYSLHGLNGETLDLDSLAHNTLLVPTEHKDHPFTPVYFDADPKKEIVFIKNAGR